MCRSDYILALFRLVWHPCGYRRTMTTYATGLEVTPPQNTNRGGGRSPLPGRRIRHAVVWPDPHGNEWSSQVTLCGKSTRNLIKSPVDPVTDWADQDNTCGQCANLFR